MGFPALDAREEFYLTITFTVPPCPAWEGIRLSELPAWEWSTAQPMSCDTGQSYKQNCLCHMRGARPQRTLLEQLLQWKSSKRTNWYLQVKFLWGHHPRTQGCNFIPFTALQLPQGPQVLQLLSSSTNILSLNIKMRFFNVIGSQFSKSMLTMEKNTKVFKIQTCRPGD